MAAGIDCTKSSSPAEIVICSNPELIKLDQELSKTYSKLSQSKHASNAALQASQHKWLQTRDKCDNEDCLRDSYSNRIYELNAAQRTMRAYKPDNVDMLALNELRQALEKRLRVDKEFPLETVLKSFEIKTGMTEFSNTGEGSGIAHFPSTRPKGVSAEEWQALVDSKIDAGGENGSASYTLLDMDNDGKRDLMIDTYMGGTGLFNYISALKRDGDKFAGKVASLQSAVAETDTDDYSLYSINGRGSNQSAHWLRLQGRVYVAYVDGNYGVDHVSLMRPLHINETTPQLSIHYQYTFSIPKKQVSYDTANKPTELTLDANTQAALSKALSLANPTVAQDNGESKLICTPPKNISEDEHADYYSFGSGHYSYEIVSDFPIWLGKTCHIGRLINWFGGYDKAGGLHAQLWTKLPNSGDDQTKAYDVKGRRKLIKIDSGLAKIDLGEN